MTDLIQTAYDVLDLVMQPACTQLGVSYKRMPNDKTFGVVRNACAIVFVPGYALPSTTTSATRWAKQTSMSKVKAYVLVLAASQTGPGSATWLMQELFKALHDKLVNGIRIMVSEASFSKYEDGVWQYRLELDISIPFSSTMTELN